MPSICKLTSPGGPLRLMGLGHVSAGGHLRGLGITPLQKGQNIRFFGQKKHGQGAGPWQGGQKDARMATKGPRFGHTSCFGHFKHF